MTTQNHTPGPWTWNARGNHIQTTAPVNNNTFPTLIAAPIGGKDESTFNANARLIAAAPELLDALIVLLDHAQEKYPHFESERGQADIARALAAIAKAKGE